MVYDDDAAYTLVSGARQFVPILLHICCKGKKLPPDFLSLASKIATRLHIASLCIEELPQYWIESSVDQLCRDVLKHLAMIYMVCHFSRKGDQGLFLNMTSGQRECKSGRGGLLSLIIATCWPKKVPRRIYQA